MSERKPSRASVAAPRLTGSGDSVERTIRMAASGRLNACRVKDATWRIDCSRGEVAAEDVGRGRF
jgi:hypothetical protein